MIGMTLQITANTAGPVLDTVARGLQTENLLPYLAEAGTQEVQANLMGLEQSRPNRLNGTRQHYYQNAANNTTWTMDGDTAVISVAAPGITTRFFGGTIRAGSGVVQCGPNAGRPTKYLTIPVAPEAYGRRACDLPDVVVLWGRNGPYALGRISRRSQATQAGGGASAEFREVLYVLKKEVTINADPSLLPSGLRMTAVLKVAFADYVSLLKEQGMREGGAT